MSKILITGATGTIGKTTIAALLEAGQPFVAGVRNMQRGKELLKLEDDQLVRFDFKDPATFETATAGVNKVFLLGPPLDTELDALLSPFIDFLGSKNIKRVVYLSAMGIDQVPSLPFHASLVHKLNDDGFDYTILKPSFFATNFKNYELQNINQYNIIYAVAGNGKVGFIDPTDIGNVAAKVLQDDGHTGKTHELTGPELHSYQDVADLLSEILGRKISYPNPNEEQYIDTLKAAGAPDFVAPYMIAVSSLIKNESTSYLTSAVEDITHKKPTALKEVLQRDFAALETTD